MPCDSHSIEDWKKLYEKLAMEAFHYAAESGSEYAMIWFLNCTCKMFYYIKDENFHWIMMLHSGFTLYNLALDFKGRYAAMYKSLYELFDAINEYEKLSEHFLLANNVHVTIKGQILRIMLHIIVTALRNSSWNLPEAQKAAEATRTKIESFIGIVPSIFRALCSYEEGQVANLNCDWLEAKQRFFTCFSFLKKHFEEESIEAIYCYNSLHGIFLITMVLINSHVCI